MRLWIAVPTTIIVCLLASRSFAEPVESTGLINTDRQLACKSRIDAESLARSSLPKDYSTVQDYLLELLLSGRCSVLAKGTKVFVSSQGNSGETLAIRVPGETEYRYIDMSNITRDGCSVNDLARRNVKQHYGEAGEALACR